MAPEQMMVERVRHLVLCIVAMLPLCACGVLPAAVTYRCSHPEFSGDDYQNAALNVVGLWNEMPHTQQQLNEIVERANKTRPWAQKIEDPCMRFAVLHWLDFYVSQASGNFGDIATERASDRDFNRQMQQERMRSEDLRSKTVLPPGGPVQ